MGSVSQQAAREKQGSAQSTREISRAVIEGRRLDFHSYAAPVGPFTSGYVCGNDDFHWKVADTQRKKVVLVHKSATFVVIHDDNTLDADITADEWLRDVVTPYRDRCIRQFNGLDEPEEKTA